MASHEGDGTGGVLMELPSGGKVFVTRWYDRGEPDSPTPNDWREARAIAALVKAAVDGGSWEALLKSQSGDP
jgi:hypothetical protein